jgi:peptide/nickel transport system permease protein
LDLFKYFLKRIFYSLFVLFGLSLLIFSIARSLPGDPVRIALGPRASQEAVDQLREEMDLDKPLLKQYSLWLGDVFNGNLGYSLRTKRSVNEDLKQYIPGTLELIVIALIIEAVGGILLGAITANSKSKILGSTVRIGAYLGIAMPAFIWSILFMLLFVQLYPIFPIMGRFSSNVPQSPIVTGMITIDSLIDGNIPAFWDALKYLVLPAISLSLSGLSQVTRMMRSSMLEILDKDYIWAETASGIPRRRITYRYALKPALPSTISVIGMDMAAMLANAFLVEKVFGFPGFSKYGLEAMLNKDVNAIVSVVLVVGIAFVMVNIVVDIINAALDPRNRLLGGA